MRKDPIRSEVPEIIIETLRFLDQYRNPENLLINTKALRSLGCVRDPIGFLAHYKFRPWMSVGCCRDFRIFSLL